MRSGNPALKSDTFDIKAASGDTMTMQGVTHKTFLLLFLVVLSAAVMWSRFQSDPAGSMMIGLICALIALVIAFIIVFNKRFAKIGSIAYALLEGAAVGGISAYYEAQFEGIVIQAVGLTFLTLFVMLNLYRFEIIKVTRNFMIGVVSATGAIALLYLVDIGMGLFGFGSIGFIHESTPLGIAFSLFVVGIAALNLVLDFDFIEKGVEGGAPAYMEWYAAFGLLVTLIWLYLEILRLLAKIRNR